MIYMVVTYSDYVHYVLWVGELTGCKFQNGVDFGSFKRKFFSETLDGCILWKYTSVNKTSVAIIYPFDPLEMSLSQKGYVSMIWDY